MVLELRSQGKTYKSISQMLNRTPISIERKYKTLLKMETIGDRIYF